MSAMAAWLARRIHIIRVLLHLCGLLLFSCWLNAAIHANSWTPPTLAFLTVFLALLLGYLLVPPVLACWMLYAARMAAITNHHGTNMGSRRAGVACTLLLLVRLACHHASFVLCCPCATISASEVCLHQLSGWWWLWWCCWLPSPWFLVPNPHLRSLHRALLGVHACFWSSNPLGPHRPCRLLNLLHGGKREVSREAGSDSLRSGVMVQCDIQRNL